MQISNIQNIIYTNNAYKQSFAADLKNRVKIGKRTDFDTFEKTDASIVQFNRACNHDETALKDASSAWDEMSDKSHTFAKVIYEDFKQYDSLYKEGEAQFIGLTLQNENFEEMQASQILGLAEVAHFDELDIVPFVKDGHFLELLQTIPISKHGTSNREHKGIGQNLLDYVIQEYSSKPLLVVPTESAAPFYEANGFETIQGYGMMMYTGKNNI